jgi:hypothetical protein
VPRCAGFRVGDEAIGQARRLRAAQPEVLLVSLLVLMSPIGAFAQQPSAASSDPGGPTVTVTAGAGNAMGVVGAQAERYLKGGRMSLFGGIGYLPRIDPGDPTGVSAAGGARLYTSGRRHRAFVEASVSEILSETLVAQGVVLRQSRRFGPGVQVGYQFVSRRGITGILSLGAGVPVGAESGARAALMAGMGLGYTWRR